MGQKFRRIIALSSRVFEIEAFLCFAIFAKISKIQNGRHFCRDKFFWKYTWLLCESKISSKSLYLAGFSRYKHFYVLQFLRKIQNGRHFGGDKYFFENRHGYSAEIPCGSKISSKSLHLVRFSRYKHFHVLQFLQKTRKFKMAAIFGETKFFSKLG